MIIAEFLKYIDIIHKNVLNIIQDYGFDIILKYEDRDGDMISLETEMDFQDLLSTLGDVVVNDTVSIFVNKNEKQKDDSSNSNDNHKKNSGNGKNISDNSQNRSSSSYGDRLDSSIVVQAMI